MTRFCFICPVVAIVVATAWITQQPKVVHAFHWPHMSSFGRIHSMADSGDKTTSIEPHPPLTPPPKMDTLADQNVVVDQQQHQDPLYFVSDLNEKKSNNNNKDSIQITTNSEAKDTLPTPKVEQDTYSKPDPQLQPTYTSSTATEPEMQSSFSVSPETLEELSRAGKELQEGLAVVSETIVDELLVSAL